MYLGDLTYIEKQAYMKLAMMLISADNEITQKELNMLELQSKEMGDYEMPSFATLEKIDAKELLKDSSPSTHRKIYFELLLIAFSDSFEEEESDLLDTYRNAIGMDESERTKFELCAKAITDTFYVLDKLINI